jgi:hypothetical protein
MTDATTISPFAEPRMAALRGRIDFLCQIGRCAIVGWTAWLCYAVLFEWSDPARVSAAFAKSFGRDISGFSSMQHVGLYACAGLAWLLSLCACFYGWRLLTLYRAGAIFGAQPAAALLGAGAFGLASRLADIATRPALTFIASAHLPPEQRVVGIPATPDDIVVALLFVGLIVLAQIQMTAAEIAGEHAQFV